jgi:hypothetical protein
MIHWWSFLAGVVAVILFSLAAVLLFILWDTRAWPVERKSPFGKKR